MIVLTLRTDKPESELAVYDGKKRTVALNWEAHRQLAETIHAKIDEIIEQSNHNLADIQGIVCFKGPGSFTGLRIGLTVANTLSAIHHVPIVADGSENWQEAGITRLESGDNDIVALPEYGAPATTTMPKK